MAPFSIAFVACPSVLKHLKLPSAARVYDAQSVLRTPRTGVCAGAMREAAASIRKPSPIGWTSSHVARGGKKLTLTLYSIPSG